jgi:DNAJ protein RME-8 N-terminal
MSGAQEKLILTVLSVVLLLISSDESLTSCAEFIVQKLSPRTSDPVRRTLCLTETCLVERDPATYSVVSCKPLCDVSIDKYWIRLQMILVLKCSLGLVVGLFDLYPCLLRSTI